MGMIQLCETRVWSGVEWSGVEWSGVEWSGVEWSGVEWSGVEWSGVEWSGVEWSGVEWSGVEWSGVEWSGVEWSDVTARNDVTDFIERNDTPSCNDTISFFLHTKYEDLDKALQEDICNIVQYCTRATKDDKHLFPGDTTESFLLHYT